MNNAGKDLQSVLSRAVTAAAVARGAAASGDGPRPSARDMAPREDPLYRNTRILVRVVAISVVAAIPLIASPSIMLVATSALIFSLFALSLNLLLGTAGLISFGHAAYFGVGCYALAFLVKAGGLPPMLALALAPLIALLVSAVAGLIALRAKEIYFSLITLGIAQLLYANTLAWAHITGGSDGITGRFAPAYLLASPAAFYWFVLAVVGGCTLLLWALTHSPYGDVLRGIRENRLRAECMGLPVKAYEYTAFLLAALFAGVSGALFVMFQLQAYPQTLHWTMSAEPMMMALLGGLNAFLGPAVGAFALTFMRNIIGQASVYWDVILGVLIVAVALLMPAGITSGMRAAGEWMAELLGFGRGQPGAPSDGGGAGAAVAPADSDHLSSTPATGHGRSRRVEIASATPILQVEGLSKSFGALHAVRDVNLRVRKGSIHAVIGPNGAGKSTLFNLICGLLPPNRGRVIFDGEDIGHLSSWRLARRGIGRSFQQASLFWDLPVWTNVALAAAASLSAAARPVGRIPAEAVDRAALVLHEMGLKHLAGHKAAELSHGDQRALELATAIAGGSRLLLLDEPTAGLSPAETRSAVQNIVRLAEMQDLTVLLVEHDMQVVFGIADTITVLADGAVIAEGTPEEIRADPLVQRAYLGADDDGEGGSGNDR